jgi:hypothetical protein
MRMKSVTKLAKALIDAPTAEAAAAALGYKTCDSLSAGISGLLAKVQGHPNGPEFCEQGRIHLKRLHMQAETAEPS